MFKNLVLIRALGGLVLLLVAALPAMAADAPKTADLLADHVLGKADAPVTMIEYASLTCPHCANFAKETLPLVKKEYVETGKVKLIYRDFPLDRLAVTAAMMARCAPKERYFGLIETLFLTQRTWAGANDPKAALERLGQVAGLGKDDFEACMNDRALFEGIVDMRAKADKDYKVDSTPTFIVDGEKFTGDLAIADFRKKLDAALAAKGK